MKSEILITRGDTFAMVVLWEDRDVIVRKPITAISLASGAPRLSVAAHGLPAAWRGYCTMVGGMREINAENVPPRDSDFHEVTVINADTIELNGVDPVNDNGRAWSDYTSGGFFNFYAVKDLSSATARMQIRTKIGGALIASSEVADTPLDSINIEVSSVTKRTTVVISAANTAAISAKSGVTNLEMVEPGDVVTKLKLTSAEYGCPDMVRIVGEATT
jgi:hypothetical protein